MAEASETDPKRSEECGSAPSGQCVLGDKSGVRSGDYREQSGDAQESDEAGIHEAPAKFFYSDVRNQCRLQIYCEPRSRIPDAEVPHILGPSSPNAQSPRSAM